MIRKRSQLRWRWVSLVLSAWIAADGVLHNLSKASRCSDLFELILVFSGFFIYQNLLFKPDRQAFKEKVSKTFDDIL